MSLDEINFEYFEVRIKRRRRLTKILLVLSLVGFILAFYCIFKSNDWIVNYRLGKFNNLGITTCTTKSMSCGKSGCSIHYSYTINNVLYGGSAKEGKRYSYRGIKYYIVYSKDDPTLQIILPEYDVSIPLNPDTLKREYLAERIDCYLKAQKKEDWAEWIWNSTFEYQKDDGLWDKMW